MGGCVPLEQCQRDKGSVPCAEGEQGRRGDVCPSSSASGTRAVFPVQRGNRADGGMCPSSSVPYIEGEIKIS